MQHVFIIGSKGIPAAYGGFETFVENLTGRQVSRDICYHVSCMSDKEQELKYHGVCCFHVKTPDIGPARAVYYDVAAFRRCLKTIQEKKLEQPIVYVLACRIGPFAGYLRRKLLRLGGRLYVNPDGHEFLRAKWNALIRRYWKFSERGMVRQADLMICDSKNMEHYIRQEYEKYHPETMFIAYGTDVEEADPAEPSLQSRLEEWYGRLGITKESYYLVVGRFVPENNYETMLREFMASHTEKSLVLITNAEQNAFYERLREQTGFDRDLRIKFAGTVYDTKLLAQIRAGAYGYLHGHEVGGTNPSLLEALGSTKLNLLLNVGFNREVAGETALYWEKSPGNLAGLLEQADRMEERSRKELGQAARARMRQHYSWEGIVGQYERLFLDKNMK